jgi:uncharacterized protein
LRRCSRKSDKAATKPSCYNIALYHILAFAEPSENNNPYEEKMLTIVVRFILYFLVGYAIIIVFVFFWQRRLLYYPHHAMPVPSQLQALGLRSWPGEGSTLRGYTAGQAPNRHIGTIVVFHGNAGAAWNRDYYVEALEPPGYRVVLAEYPGYGGRAGPLSEDSFVADAKETVRLAFHEFGGPVFLVAESLGCGVAAGVAADPAIPVKGIALFTPWDTLPNLAQKIYWFLPVRWLVQDKFDNVKNLEHYRGRIALILAGQDEIIPTSLGLKLYQSLGSKKKLWVLENARHNTWMDMVDAGWWKEIMDFLSQGE